MYEFYYFETKPDIYGRHLVHRDSCLYLPKKENRTLLSYDNSSVDALKKAKNERLEKIFYLCALCCKTINTD